MRESRRSFLKSAGISAASAARGASQPKSHPSHFAPAGAPRKLTDNLYLFEDTCNVYVVRDGSSCVLIDFGSGKILDHLQDLGIAKVDWILHTHHHRDQCQGDDRAVERRIPIAAPQHERHLFEDAENFWRNRRVFHLYYVRNDFNTLTENVPIARTLPDYGTFNWGKFDFFVLPTPGHTLGSITLVATVDGKRAAFSGDLMMAPGKVLNLYDMQVNYGGFEGVDLGTYAMKYLLEQKPELLCPSHGEPMQDPAGAIAGTQRRLLDFYRFETGTPDLENRPFAVSPHLVASFQTTSSFYALVSNSGKTMFIDYGAASNVHFNNFERATPATGRIRFVEHTIDELEKSYGMKSIDVAMPSHMHDDHMNGFPYLIGRHGTKVWCLDNMVEIFENPRGYNLGCTLGEPFKVARSFRPGERFKWEEFDFEITHSPGHTEYQMALYVTVDGQKIAFTGDALFPYPDRTNILRHNIIFRNHVENDSHLKSIRNMIGHEPTLLCPGHGKPYPVTRELLLATEQKLRQQQQFFFDLLPEGEVDFGLDPSWLKIYPYQAMVKPGRTETLKIMAQNYHPSPMKLEVALAAPAEWRIDPGVLKFEVPARSKAAHELRVTIPRSWTPRSPRFAIAADVMRDGKYLGQITEAVVEIAG
jgi:glyoxylase-like metal-dependent hydrolase (beta-lactamase superfamily II)